jgi:hypothetical protein
VRGCSRQVHPPQAGGGDFVAAGDPARAKSIHPNAGFCMRCSEPGFIVLSYLHSSNIIPPAGRRNFHAHYTFCASRIHLD